MELNNPIFASWYDIRQDKRGVRVIETVDELEVLHIFERAGHIDIQLLHELVI